MFPSNTNNSNVVEHFIDYSLPSSFSLSPMTTSQLSQSHQSGSSKSQSPILSSPDQTLTTFNSSGIDLFIDLLVLPSTSLVKIPQPPKVFNKHSTTIPANSGIYKPKVLAMQVILAEPKIVNKTLNTPKWLDLMKKKFQALIANNTSELVLPHLNAKIIENKWVFRVKLKVDKILERYKNRIVAKGYNYTLDYI